MTGHLIAYAADGDLVVAIALLAFSAGAGLRHLADARRRR